MAKILCGTSGVEFECSFLSLSLHSREYSHPVFYLPHKKLLGLYSKYVQGEMGETESYLLFLAYLKSTGLIEFRVPAQRTALTSSIIAANFHDLILVSEKIRTTPHPESIFSQFVISPDTKSLDNIPYIIASWEQAFEDFKDGYRASKKRESIAELEEKLDRILFSPSKSETIFAAKLAEWAAKAGDFPQFSCSTPFGLLSLDSYWKLIIRKCVNQESIFSVPEKDLAELLSHCEDNIEAGSTYSHHLFSLLRKGVHSQTSFLGLGTSTYNFTILPEESSVETANKAAIVANAPLTPPARIDYPNNFAYIKAKLAFDMAASTSQNQTGASK